MVEYRVDPEGRPWLMEVNARFWGSLQLAIDAGADFPAWLASNDPPPFDVKKGARLQWMLGDLDRLWLVAKAARKGEKVRLGKEIAHFVASLCNPQIRSEVFRWSDPKPGWHELKRWCAGLRRP